MNDRADKAGESMMIDPFETPHNRTITWDDLLRQVSDWEGTLWGKPDWADRPAPNPATWTTRERARPGAAYEYNDVRVNVLALAAQNVWRRPLPQVLAGNHGPDRRLEDLALVRLRQLVDHARRPAGAVGERRRPLGRRHVHQRVGHGAVRHCSRCAAASGATSSSSAKVGDDGAHAHAGAADYGFMNWFLNTERSGCRARRRPRSATWGTGRIWSIVDPEHDLVAVVRWIEGGKENEFLKRLLAAVK